MNVTRNGMFAPVFLFFSLLSRKNEMEKIWRPLVDRRICAGMFLRYGFALRKRLFFVEEIAREHVK
jgi:hypothetical protein